MNSPKTIRGTKRLFLKLGTCSQLLFHVLNREFGHPKKIEERAADPLAGGIMQKGHQCGMLWGSALAVGAESFRRHHNDGGQAIGVAITATQHLMESFSKRTHSVNCRDITGCDWFRWMNTLAWHREAGNGKSAMLNPRAENTSRAFYDVTGAKVLCHKICGQRFETIDEHTEFIKNGGCNELIEALAQ